MSIYRQPKSPYWWVRFSIGGVKTRRSSQTTERAAAEEFETKLRADLWRQNKLGERPRYTWDEALKRWNAEADHRGKAKEYARAAWFTQYLAGVPLAEIGRDLIDQCRTVRAKEASHSTANRDMSILRAILNKAHRDWDWIDRVPHVPMYRVERPEPRFLTRIQYERLERKLPTHLKPLARFSVETGVRMRNATHLQWSQIDLKRKVMIVPANRAKGGETLAIPLNPRAVAVLRAQTKVKGQPNVFLYNGKPIDDANTAAFKKATKAAGIPWFRWHDLRHTWASWHIQSGTAPNLVQAMGGWKSQAMVDRYGHLNPSHLLPYADHGMGRLRIGHTGKH